MRMQEVFLSLGGNVGDVAATLEEAKVKISLLPNVVDVSCSHMYRSSPLGASAEPDFFNYVLRIKTPLLPKQLHACFESIEFELCKIKKPKVGPRPIDIDILLYGRLQYHDDDLEIPHPEWKNRLFVLVPLSELSSNVGGVDIRKRIDELRSRGDQKIELVQS
jgi:2-amino-4-hydroxy-6-hydroxymethyldihydropteridine diphosphokinase